MQNLCAFILTISIFLFPAIIKNCHAGWPWSNLSVNGALCRSNLRDTSKHLENILKKCGKEVPTASAVHSSDVPFEDQVEIILNQIQELSQKILKRNGEEKKYGRDKNVIEDGLEILRSRERIKKSIEELKIIVDTAKTQLDIKEAKLVQKQQNGKQAHDLEVKVQNLKNVWQSYQRDFQMLETAFEGLRGLESQRGHSGSRNRENRPSRSLESASFSSAHHGNDTTVRTRDGRN